jgi:hypothetical protein
VQKDVRGAAMCGERYSAALAPITANKSRAAVARHRSASGGSAPEGRGEKARRSVPVEAHAGVSDTIALSTGGKSGDTGCGGLGFTNASVPHEPGVACAAQTSGTCQDVYRRLEADRW